MSVTPSWPALASIHTIVFDFDGVFTDNKVYLNQDGVESVRCDRGDGLGLDILRSARERGRIKADIFILSKEPNPVVLARARKLKLDCKHGVARKKDFMDAYFAEHRQIDPAPYAGLIFLGNDLNDLALMCAAGFSIAPDDAHPLVKRHASAVLPLCGGEGFVRAFVEQLLNVGTMTLEELNELVHHC
jgi:N-acylneuraminate cytidylyltransferase